MARPSRRAATVGGSLAAAATAGAVAAHRRHQRHEVTGSHPDGSHPFGHTPDHVETATATDGTVLHVEVDEPPGSTRRGRPTVVLVHGFTLDLTAWVMLRRRLVTEGYRVVTYDQRGHGVSGTGERDLSTIEQLGLDLRSVLDAVAPKGPVVLVGHSMGGMSIMSFAGSYPTYVDERVRAIALVSTSAGGVGLVSVVTGRLLDAFVVRLGPSVLVNLSRRRALWGGMRKVGRDMEMASVQRFGFGAPVPREVLRYYSDIIFGTPLETTAAFLPHLDDLDVRDALSGLARSTVLVLVGSKDELTPPSHSDDIVALVPRSEHVVVPGAGHLLPMERPEVVATEVLGLIERGLKAPGQTRAPRTKGKPAVEQEASA